MQSYYKVRKPNMQKYILTKPKGFSSLTFDNFYDDEETEDAWEEKARRLQVRRWRKIKHQLV
jgi:hypothetical protein